MTDAFLINPSSIRDLSSDLLDDSGRLKVMPASYYQSTSREERTVFCTRYAHYGLPTVELVDWLRSAIDGRTAIEIGSGCGVLAHALGIPATDNRMQEDPAIVAHYRLMQQSVISYGRNVEKLDAHAAVQKYRPDVVIASWVTHKFDPRRSEAGGNQFGVVEEDIINACEAYIFIGNDKVHQGKSIWALPHQRITPPWLYSRAFNGSPDFIAVWGKGITPLS